MIPVDLASLLSREDVVEAATQAMVSRPLNVNYRDGIRAAFAAVLEVAGARPAEPGAMFTREEVDRALRLAEDRNGKPRDWHLFIDEPEADL